MATLTQALPIAKSRTSQSIQEFSKHWKNRIAYWKKEAHFIFDLVDLHLDLQQFPMNYRKARYQMGVLIEDELPALVQKIKALNTDKPTAGNGQFRDQIRQKLIRMEQKYNLLKLVLLEVAAEGIPLRLG
ncbi:MAG: hypothetical protein HRU41_12205 [Saprospiraceae bacterium]|nr:hypothetical protein [Saprospiraceae bacterium]